MGTLIADRYRIVQVLGKSDFGQTLLAIDQARSPETLCVIKSVANFANTPIITAKISQTPISQYPQCWEEFTNQGIFYRVWEYIAGENLATTLAQQEIFVPQDIWQILISILPVLQQIHSQGIIHGDIKPENIIAIAKQVKLREPPLRDCSLNQNHLNPLGSYNICRFPPADFVLVGLEGIRIFSYHPPTLPMIGSPAYAAPEQLAGQPTFASDLYSLGVTCIHLLTGMHPFSLFDFMAHQWVWQDYWLPSAPQANSPQINRERQQLAQFLDRLIAPALNQRYNSALTALNHLQTLQGKTKTPLSKFMNMPTGKCIATLVGHQGLFAGVNAVAITADGQTLASASDDQTIRLWDLPTGKARSILRGHGNFVKSIAFHPTQPQILASGSKDRTIKLWDIQTRELLQTLTQHQQAVNALSFSPDGEILGSGSADKTIILWQHRTGEIITILKGHNLSINAIAFSPQAPLLASASMDTTIKLWDFSTGELNSTLTAHTAAVKALAFSPDGQYLATGGEDRTIRIWDVVSHQCLQTLSGHPWDISALSFINSRDLRSNIAVTKQDMLWEPSQSDDSHNMNHPNSFDDCHSIKSNPDILLSSSWDKTIKLWQVNTGENLDTLIGHTEAVNCLAIYQHLIISGSSDTTIKIWNYSE